MKNKTLCPTNIYLTLGLIFFIQNVLTRPIYGQTTYLSGDQSQSEKISRLKPFFVPTIGQTVEVDSRELRDFDHKKSKINPLNLRGFIKVSPPKKHCFTITRHPDLPDDHICKPTLLSFTLNDLNKDGSIRWTIKTGPLDFGTDIQWKSPYRLASVMPHDADKDIVVHKLIQSCQAKRQTALGHQIIVRFFGGEEWLIDFPEEEELLPQPRPMPNLYIAVAAKKGIPKSKKSTATETTTTTKTQEPNESLATATGTQTTTSNPNPGTITETDDPIESEFNDREAWAIPKRNGYRMDGYRFMPFGTTTKWAKGECRYIYSGPPEDATTGRLECHDVDGFKEIYLPLTCLSEFSRLKLPP